MPTQNEDLQRLQGHLLFLASATHGLETVIGRGAPTVAFGSGRKSGLKTQLKCGKDPDLLKALGLCQAEMLRLGIVWPFEPHKKKSDASLVARGADGREVVRIAVHHCVGRAALFRYAHPQKISMCNLYHGVFAGILEQILGRRVLVDIRHAGENACYLELTAGKA